MRGARGRPAGALRPRFRFRFRFECGGGRYHGVHVGRLPRPGTVRRGAQPACPARANGGRRRRAAAAVETIRWGRPRQGEARGGWAAGRGRPAAAAWRASRLHPTPTPPRGDRVERQSCTQTAACARHHPPPATRRPRPSNPSLAPRGRGRGVGRPVQARRVDPDRAHALGRAQVVIHDAGRHRNDVVALHGVGNGRGRGWESVRAVGSRAPRSAARHRRPSRRAPAHSTAPSTPPPSSPVSPSST